MSGLRVLLKHKLIQRPLDIDYSLTYCVETWCVWNDTAKSLYAYNVALSKLSLQPNQFHFNKITIKS